MFRPSDTSTDYLHFECASCHQIVDFATEITPDAPLKGEAKFNIRNWDMFRINLQCDQCGEEGSFKMRLCPPKKSSELPS